MKEDEDILHKYTISKNSSSSAIELKWVFENTQQTTEYIISFFPFILNLT